MKETENIKDPNQLDLFAGIVLTVEQQKQVDHYIDSVNKNTKNVKNKETKEEIIVIEKELEYSIKWIGKDAFDSDKVESDELSNIEAINITPNEYMEPSIVVDPKYFALLFACTLPSEIASRINLNDTTLDTIDLQISAYKLQIKIPSHKLLCLYLPTPVLPSSCTCKVTQRENKIGSVDLFIKLCLDNSDIDKEPDVGSKAWLISQALRSEDSRNSNSTSSESKTTNDYEYPEDKFHIKMPDNVNPYTGLKEEVNDDVLPEERFHMKDAHSTFLINQREQSIKDKQEHFENEKKNRKNDENVEYVDIDDFKPGGKYATSNSKPGSTPDVATYAIEPINKVKEVILSNNSDMVVIF